ncbi:MAG: hypothetical protein LBL94_00070 [Prevotellaceae bacterium]|jgi:hypothetical protein|nr:hypothetical protein [Prevotellaceae bacterium]
METLSIDTAAEGLAFLLASKMKMTDFAPGIELALLESEITQLQDERQIIYGGVSKEDFDNVMQKIVNIYAPLIKHAVTGKRSSEHLSAA